MTTPTDGRTGHPPMSTRPTWLTIIAAATAGGIARYLDNFLHGKRFALSAFIAAIFVSGFCGWTVAQFADVSGHPTWLAVSAGIGGFMGTQSLDLAFALIRKRLGIEEPKEPTP